MIQHDSKEYMQPNIHCTALHSIQSMEVTEGFISRGKNKENVVRISSMGIQHQY